MIGSEAAPAAVLLLGLAAVASARWNWWRPRVQGLRVLTYHKIGDAPSGTRIAYLWITAATFRRQMEYLKTNGWTTLTLSELRDVQAGKRDMPERPVLVTFDDGFANNYELAWPVLKELGMKANIFLVTSELGKDSSWDRAPEPVIPMLSWAQAKEMQASGVIEFGSHTTSHRDLVALSPVQARQELSGSKAALEAALGREIVGFAYPYGSGAGSPAVRALVHEAGYHYDFGIVHGVSAWPWDRGAGALKRLYVKAGDSMLDFHLNLTRGRAKLSRRFWRDLNSD